MRAGHRPALRLAGVRGGLNLALEAWASFCPRLPLTRSEESAQLAYETVRDPDGVLSLFLWDVPALPIVADEAHLVEEAEILAEGNIQPSRLDQVLMDGGDQPAVLGKAEALRHESCAGGIEHRVVSPRGREVMEAALGEGPCCAQGLSGACQVGLDLCVLRHAYTRIPSAMALR